MDSSGKTPPALPPRTPPVPTASSLDKSPPPPPYEEVDSSWPSDPRSSSTLSLIPSADSAAHSNKRKLLLIYIHGFYGNDQSFRSLPYHVHCRLKDALSSSHVIHSKIYPRYKTYKSIEIARNQFSAWLEPHESPTTDVVLIGHSMGGILAGDVVLMPRRNDSKDEYPFRHRILGTLSLDSPFLGLHPGIIASGVASLFQPAATPPAGPSPARSPAASQVTSPGPSIDSLSLSESNASLPTLYDSSSGAPSLHQAADLSYNPPFFNDKPFAEQPFFNRLVNFATKHQAEGIFKALSHHVLSHLEFGGILADYPGLIRRYRKLRWLEEPVQDQPSQHSAQKARVRFINYYTICTGVTKEPKPAKDLSRETTQQGDDDVSQTCTRHESDEEDGVQDSRLPSRGVEAKSPDVDVTSTKLQDDTPESLFTNEPGDPDKSTQEASEPVTGSMRPLSMQHVDPVPLSEDEDGDELVGADSPTASTPHTTTSLEETPNTPQRPQPPPKPELPDIHSDMDKEAMKQARKETKRLQSAYEASMKQYTTALQAHEKATAKQLKDQKRQDARLDKEALKAHQQREKEEAKARRREEKKLADEAKRLKKEQAGTKYRKFCTLPGKIRGEQDPTWVSVYMEGVDEVGAHCGLFVEEGNHYDKLVSDIVGRLRTWVDQDEVSQEERKSSV